MRDRLGMMLVLEDMDRNELARHIRALRRALMRVNGTVRNGVVPHLAIAWDEMCRRQYEKRFTKFTPGW